MYSKALNQSLCILMLLVVAVGTTFSAIGEFRSHSALSTVETGHVHAHATGHSHELQGEYQFHHDASNHTHDNASLKDVSQIVLAQLTEIGYCWQFSGHPIHHPFKIERPPRTPLFT